MKKIICGALAALSLSNPALAADDFKAGVDIDPWLIGLGIGYTF